MTLDDAERLIAEGRLAEAEIVCAQNLGAGQDQRAYALYQQIQSMVRDGTSESPVTQQYHLWFYNTLRWQKRTWMGISTLKSPLDMWNYQEIICELRPSLIVEYGTHAGGSALFFAQLLAGISPGARVISVDISLKNVPENVRALPSITFVEASSTDPAVTALVARARSECAGPAFFILDSDHAAEHVYQELVSLREVVQSGDHLVIEDGNVNGHPILPNWGPGPTEAREQYQKLYPDDYRFDAARERVFGWTFATGGFLIRN
jgi:cephalosporin hydroxylase